MSPRAALIAGLREYAHGLPAPFWWLWLGTLVNRVGIFVLPFMTLFLTRQRGFSTAQATLTVSLYGIGSFASHFAGGALADRVGRRPTIVLSMFGTAALLAMLAVTRSLAGISVVMMVLGLFTDLYRPASAALISDVVSPAHRAKAFALRYWAINLGAAVGLLLAGILARHNYLLLFVGDALTTLGFGVIVMCLVPETRPVPAPAVRVATATSTEGAATNGASDPARASPPFAGSPAAAHGEVRLLAFTLGFALLSLLTAMVYMQGEVTLPLAMLRNGLDERDYGAAIALNGIVIVLFSLALNRLLAPRSHFTVLAASALLIGAGFAVNAYAHALPMYALGVVVWTIGEMIGAPLAPTIVAELAPVQRRGTSQGILGASYGLAAFLGPLLGGWTYERLGERALWMGCLALAGIAAVAYEVVMAPWYRRLVRARKARVGAADGRA